MTLPKVKMDWTINVTSLCSAILFLFTVVGAWYNLKNEVTTNKITSDLKFNSVDQNIFDLRQTVVTATSEIHTDIREIRSILIPPNHR